MFLAGERSNHNFPDFGKNGVFKCTANIYGGSARNVINQNYLTARHFSANGIELPLGEPEMKVFERFALRGFAACSHVPFSRGSLRSPNMESLLSG